MIRQASCKKKRIGLELCWTKTIIKAQYIGDIKIFEVNMTFILTNVYFMSGEATSEMYIFFTSGDLNVIN